MALAAIAFLNRLATYGELGNLWQRTRGWRAKSQAMISAFPGSQLLTPGSLIVWQPMASPAKQWAIQGIYVGAASPKLPKSGLDSQPRHSLQLVRH
jgi:hypothetical protein